MFEPEKLITILAVAMVSNLAANIFDRLFEHKTW